MSIITQRLSLKLEGKLRKIKPHFQKGKAGLKKKKKRKCRGRKPKKHEVIP